MQKSFFEYINQYGLAAVLALVVLTLGGLVIKRAIEDRNHDKSLASNLNRSEIVRQFTETPNEATQPLAVPPVSSSDQSGAVPQVSLNDLRGPGAPQPEVLGSSINTTTPVPPPAAPTPSAAFKPYRNDQLGFETMVPFDTAVNATATQATAAGLKGAYWTLTVYDRTSETIDSLVNELSRSPSVTNLARTTLGGKPALQFSSPNLGGAGFAVIHNGRLYYLIGNFSNPLVLKDFKFL